MSDNQDNRLFYVTLSNLTAGQVADLMTHWTAGAYYHPLVWEKEAPPEVQTVAQYPTIEQEASLAAPQPKKSLVDLILLYADFGEGVSRKYLKTIASENGFNVGSLSPTLVKLIKAKKIKRIGKGMYQTPHWRKV